MIKLTRCNTVVLEDSETKSVTKESIESPIWVQWDAILAMRAPDPNETAYGEQSIIYIANGQVPVKEKVSEILDLIDKEEEKKKER